MKPSEKLVQIEKTREVHTYSELWHGSWVMLRVAQEYGKGQHHLHLSSIILAAFSFEAYLNHVGPRLDPDWSKNKWLTIEEKFRHIAALVGLPPIDTGKRPYQTWRRVIEFRNELAHSHSETLTLSEIVTFDNYVERFKQDPLTRWEKELISDAFPKRAREDIRQLAEALHDRRMDKKKQLFFFGIASASANVLPDGLPTPTSA